MYKLSKSSNYLCKLCTVSVRKINFSFRQHSATILGIETSCDDTGVAIVNNQKNILGEALFSQRNIHLRYGGINPITAYELHRENIESSVNDAFHNARINCEAVDAIAVTVKPGLLISLQVGVKYAKYLAKKYKKPLIPIHHMEAHALVARMYHNIDYPFLVLLISGGHCLLAVAKNVNEFLLLGRSLDNAPGEILDKVARRLKLRNIPMYSQVDGGRAIELAADRCSDYNMFKFTTPLVRNRDCNFSFSGLKDALIRTLIKKEQEYDILGSGIIPEVYELCGAVQMTVAEHLAHRTERAVIYCDKQNIIPENCKNIVVSGGVASNNFIFKSIGIIGAKLGYNVLRPPPKVCTDNGVMIAWNGVEKYLNNIDIQSDISLNEIDPEAPLGLNIIEEVKKANLSVKVPRLEKIFIE